MGSLLWYRNDLRLHDHLPLNQALQRGGPVVPLYCFDPRQFGQTPLGFAKTGAHRAQFLLESVAALRQAWRDRGSDLVIRCGQPEVVIPQLVSQLRLDRVYWQREVTAEEQAVEQSLNQALAALGIAAETVWGSTLYHPDDLPFDLSRLPELFTQFRKQVESDSSVRPVLVPPLQLPALPAIAGGDLPQLADWGLVRPAPEPRAVLPFEGGEAAGLARLQHYFWQADRLRSYKESRNGMLGADYSAKFSPWLALGCLSPRQIYAEVQRYETCRIRNDSTYWLVFELLWRDYFRFICAKHGRRIFYPSGLQGLAIAWKQDWPQFEQWRLGQSGFPLIDANMRELAATGFMSNRGRQNVASFLTKNLGIDWRWGAEWFESQLIDYDVCSNYGNWNYTAGVGNDARGFRYFNIAKQAKDYDPQGVYVKHWLPALAQVPAAKVHAPWQLSSAEQQRYGLLLGVDYPLPMVDLEKSVRTHEAIYNQALPPAPARDAAIQRRSSGRRSRQGLGRSR